MATATHTPSQTKKGRTGSGPEPEPRSPLISRSSPSPAPAFGIGQASAPPAFVLQRKVEVSAEGDAQEREAERVSKRIVSRKEADPGKGGGGGAAPAPSGPQPQAGGSGPESGPEAEPQPAPAKAPEGKQAAAQPRQPPPGSGGKPSGPSGADAGGGGAKNSGAAGQAGADQMSGAAPGGEKAGDAAAGGKQGAAAEGKSQKEGGKAVEGPEGQAGAPDMSAIAEKAIENKGPGEPLTADILSLMEGELGVDLSGVRVHQDEPAKQAAKGLKAKAFTYQNHIFLAEGESARDPELMAHELVHVVQQGAAPPKETAKKPEKISPSGGDKVQRGAWSTIKGAASTAWDHTGGYVVEKGVEYFWETLEEYAPNLVPIIREIGSKGIVGFLKGKLEGLVSGIFGGIKNGIATIKGMLAIFPTMVGKAQTLLKELSGAAGDQVLGALAKLKGLFAVVGGKVWDGLKDFFGPIGDFFSGLWNKLGLPVWEWLKSAAGEAADFIVNLGSRIWSWTAKIRSTFGRVWNWVKDKLGLGSAGGGGESAILAWVKEKAQAAWDSIKKLLAPVIEPVQAVWKKIKAFLPLEGIAKLRLKISTWIDSATSTQEKLAKKDGVVKSQEVLRDVVLPGLLGGIALLRTALSDTGQWIAGAIGSLYDSAASFLDGLARAPMVGALAPGFEWIKTGLGKLSEWAAAGVSALFDAGAEGLLFLSRFIEPILNVLQKIVLVLGDLVGGIGDFVQGTWNLIPEFIRQPIKNFIINKILKNIPFFGQFFDNKELWARLRDTAMTALKQVFLDGDLKGAAWTLFSEFLRLFNIPPELVTQILAKALAVFGSIFRNPIGFLINLMKAIRLGFSNFFDKIGTYLMKGVSGWLFGQMSSAGLEPPKDLTLKSILKLVMQLLDITLERVLKALERKIGKEKVDKLRRAGSALAGAWEWLKVLLNEGPAGLWRFLANKLTNLWDKVLESVADWAASVIVREATVKILAFLDITGIMPVINGLIAAYRAIESFMEYVREMLAILNKVLDGLAGIVKGAIEQAAGFLEMALAEAMPIAIGFLANQVGLGKLGSRIRELVEGVRDMVDKALDWLIDKAIAVGGAILGAIKGGVKAVKGGVQKLRAWWDQRHNFKAGKEGHTLFYQEGKLFMASKKGEALEKKFARFKQDLAKSQPDKLAGEKGISQKDLIVRGEKLIKDLEQYSKNVKAPSDQEVKAQQKQLAEMGATVAELLVNLDISQSLPFIDKEAVGALPDKNLKKVISSKKVKPSKTKDPVYLATVPTTPAAKDKPPVDIAKIYAEEAMNPKDQAASRLGMVVGVNTFMRVDSKKNEKVQSDLKDRLKGVRGFPSFRLGAFAFQWRPVWKMKKGEQIETLDEPSLRKVYDESEPAKKKLIQQNEDSSIQQSNIPYASVRTATAQHEYATQILGELKSANPQAQGSFIHMGDPDAASLKASASGARELTAAKKAGENIGESVFNRYDAILKNHPKAAMVVGGFEFRVQLAPGGPKPGEISTVIANEIDNRVRIAMAKAGGPRSIYPADLNMLIRADETLISALPKGGRFEGRAVRKEVLEAFKQIGIDQDQFIIDYSARLATHGERFTVSIDNEPQNPMFKDKQISVGLKWMEGLFNGMSVADVQALMQQKQSHANIFGNWGGDMARNLGIHSKLYPILSRIRNYYFGDLLRAFRKNAAKENPLALKKWADSAVSLPLYSLSQAHQKRFNKVDEKDREYHAGLIDQANKAAQAARDAIIAILKEAIKT